MTPVVIDWDYLNAGQAQSLEGKIDWKVVVPANAVAGLPTTCRRSTRTHRTRPRPGSGRSSSLRRGPEHLARRLRAAGRADAMVKAETIDKAAYANLPEVSGTRVFLTEEQTNTAKDYLAANWTKAGAEYADGSPASNHVAARSRCQRQRRRLGASCPTWPWRRSWSTPRSSCCTRPSSWWPERSPTRPTAPPWRRCAS